MAIARPPDGKAGCLAKLQDVVQGSPGAPKPTGAGLSVTHTTLGGNSTPCLMMLPTKLAGSLGASTAVKAMSWVYYPLVSTAMAGKNDVAEDAPDNVVPDGRVSCLLRSLTHLHGILKHYSIHIVCVALHHFDMICLVLGDDGSAHRSRA